MGFLINPYRLFSNIYSVQFDGVDERVQLADDGTFNTTSGTVSYWVKFDSISGTVSNWMFNVGQTNGGTTIPFSIEIRNSNRIGFQILESAITVNAFYGDTVVSTGSWYHVVVCGDGSSYNVYVNGTNQTLTTEVGSNTGRWIGYYAYSSATLEINLGCLTRRSDGHTRFLTGKMDEFSYWDTKLTSGQVTELYNSGKPTNLNTHSASANLQAWLRLGDSDTYPTITDKVGGTTGTMTNQEAGDIQTDVP